jgi:hypothetical protein
MSEPDAPKFQFGVGGMLLTVTVFAAFICVLRAMYVKLGPDSVIPVALICVILMTPTLVGAGVGYWRGKGRREATNRGTVIGFLVGVVLFVLLSCYAFLACSSPCRGRSIVL